jgi:hypothetical protein
MHMAAEIALQLEQLTGPRAIEPVLE